MRDCYVIEPNRITSIGGSLTFEQPKVGGGLCSWIVQGGGVVSIQVGSQQQYGQPGFPPHAPPQGKHWVLEGAVIHNEPLICAGYDYGGTWVLHSNNPQHDES